MDHGKEERCLVSLRIRCIKFSQGCMQGSKVHFGVGNNLQSLPKYPYRNKQTMGHKIGVPVAQGLDVSNFVNDVPSEPKFVLKWGLASNHFLRVFKGINGSWKGRNVSC